MELKRKKEKGKRRRLLVSFKSVAIIPAEPSAYLASEGKRRLLFSSCFCVVYCYQVDLLAAETLAKISKRRVKMI